MELLISIVGKAALVAPTCREMSIVTNARQDQGRIAGHQITVTSSMIS